jgi:hypothetical protein
VRAVRRGISDLLVRKVCHAGDDEQQVSGVQVCAASEGVDERTTGKRRAAVDDALGVEVRCELDGQGTQNSIVRLVKRLNEAPECFLECRRSSAFPKCIQLTDNPSKPCRCVKKLAHPGK